MNDLNNKFNKILLVLSTIIGIFLLITLGALFFHARGMMTSDVPSAPESNQTQSLEEPSDPEGYELRMNATEYQIELFEELIRTHDQFEELGTDFALEEYASAIVRNFIADFFTLSNKESRADIGGIQFFSNDVATNFTTAAMDEFYLYLGRHIEVNGQEMMPTVDSTTITSFQFGTRLKEIEDEETEEEIDIWGLIAPVEPEYEKTIIVDAEWTFAQTALPQIEQFQTAARFILMEVEGEGVRIFQIEMIEVECDFWAQCP
jgi:hypothetical protein